MSWHSVLQLLWWYNDIELFQVDFQNININESLHFNNLELTITQLVPSS